MKHNYENIPGLRQPTEQEKAWIWQLWEAEAQGMLMPNAGKRIHYLALFLSVFAVVSFDAEKFYITLSLVAIASVVMWISFKFKKARQTAQVTYNLLQYGPYSVVPFHAVKIWTGQYKRNHLTGYAAVYINNKEEHIRIPYSYACKLMQENICNVPLLLIVMPGELGVYAVPLPQYL